MDPATVVVQALVTGASAGLGDTASAAMTDGYSALKHALTRRLSGRHAALAQIEAIEGGVGASGVGGAGGGVGGSVGGSGVSGGSTDDLVRDLARELVLAGAVDDRLLADARLVLSLADPAGVRTGKYELDLREAKAVQVGDGNTQHNTFH